MLSACGGEGDDASSEVKPTPSSAITALNGLATAKVNTPTSLDLTPYVIGNGSLVNMFSGDPRCESSIGHGFGVNVVVGRAGRCDYTYTVSNEEGLQSSAQMVVVTSSIPNPVLTPVSVAVILGQTNVAINLKTLLGEAIPDGFSLTTDFVIQSASGSTNGEVNKTGALELMYTAPDALGWNYIAYTLTNASSETLIGHIFVSISDEINEPPLIEPEKGFTYPHSVVINTPLMLDLENTEGLAISDDSGSWQLSDVKAIGATVNANDANDINNKKFTFTASTVGRYDVAYIVSDHTGGSTLGVIRFHVDSVPTIPSNWTDITVNKAFYTAPLTRDKAVDAGFTSGSSEKELINGNYFDVARWSVTDAQKYCVSIGGKLPNKSELDTLRGSGSSELNKWPKAIPYFTYDHATDASGLYGLSDGSSSMFIPGYQAYLTCIDKGLANLTLTPAYDNDGVNTTTDSVIAGKPLVVEAKLTLRRDPTVGVSGITIAPSLDSVVNPTGYYFDLKTSSKLSLSAKTVLNDVTVGNCAKKCVDETSFSCQAATYDRLEKECGLYDESPNGSQIVSGLSHESLYVRNNLIKGVETIICPSATDDKGLTSCTYTNTTAGDFSVLATAELGAEVGEDAKATASVKVTPDMAQLEWTAPDNVFVGLGTDTLIPVKKADVYGNVVPGINAEIINSNPPTANWTLGRAKAGTPNISAPTDGDIVLNTQVDIDASATLQLSSITHALKEKSVHLLSGMTCPINEEGVSTNKGACVQAVELFSNDKRGAMLTGQLSVEALEEIKRRGISIPTGLNKYVSDIGGTQIVIASIHSYTMGFEVCSMYNDLKIAGRTNWAPSDDTIPNNTDFTEAAIKSLKTEDGRIRGVLWSKGQGAFVHTSWLAFVEGEDQTGTGYGAVYEQTHRANAGGAYSRDKDTITIHCESGPI
ncbi:MULTISPECIES: PAN/Apple domain-containing protein [unclassified Aliivibrio]|uniref:PAN/Apple domain-containing protein n=1 Tax=unclassified Aliivibrio TaxID=2645654 RepID=UPI00159F1427|nr:MULTISPECIES: PAN/Apple domain-containing protein [unclassified Aliivibrio]